MASDQKKPDARKQTISIACCAIGVGAALAVMNSLGLSGALPGALFGAVGGGIGGLLAWIVGALFIQERAQ
jgi:hypothetical protein